MNPQDLFVGGDKLLRADYSNGMGAACERKQEFQDAQRFYEEALSLYEEIFGRHHLTTAIVTRNLARVLRAQGNAAEAALLEDMSGDILNERWKSDYLNDAPFGGSSGFFNLLGLDDTPAAHDGPCDDALDSNVRLFRSETPIESMKF